MNTKPFTTSSLPRLGGRSAGAAEPATQLGASLARVLRKSTCVNTSSGVEKTASKIVSPCSKQLPTRLNSFDLDKRAATYFAGRKRKLGLSAPSSGSTEYELNMNRRTGHAHFGNEANDQWKKMAAGVKRIEIATAVR